MGSHVGHPLTSGDYAGFENYTDQSRGSGYLPSADSPRTNPGFVAKCLYIYANFTPMTHQVVGIHVDFEVHYTPHLEGRQHRIVVVRQTVPVVALVPSLLCGCARVLFLGRMQ